MSEALSYTEVHALMSNLSDITESLEIIARAASISMGKAEDEFMERMDAKKNPTLLTREDVVTFRSLMMDHFENHLSHDVQCTAECRLDCYQDTINDLIRQRAEML
jgi:hypothetical protein